MTFIAIGVEHFREPLKFVKIVPFYLPEAHFWVYMTGVLEIVLGGAIIIPQYRKVAGRSMALFLLLVYLANLHMWLYDIPFDGVLMTPEQHLFRLLIQILLIVIAMGFSGDLLHLIKKIRAG